MQKNGFSKIEILYIIVIAAIVLVFGLGAVTVAYRNKKVDNFKEDVESYIKSAKNLYGILSIEENEDYIKYSDDQTTKGMCITLNGLKLNKYTDRDLTNWDGYIVIEELDDTYTYTVWITNKEYVIDGYTDEKVPTLTLNNEITNYNGEEFTSRVATSFTGTTNTKGGTGSDTIVKRYENPCINTEINLK